MGNKNFKEMSWYILCYYFCVYFCQRQALFSFAIISRPDPGPTHPHIQRIPGVLYPWVKRSGREAKYSPPSSAEAKNAWGYTSTPPHVFLAWCLKTHMYNSDLHFYVSICLKKVAEYMISGIE
jgi:hypothetical protein